MLNYTVRYNYTPNLLSSLKHYQKEIASTLNIPPQQIFVEPVNHYHIYCAKLLVKNTTNTKTYYIKSLDNNYFDNSDKKCLYDICINDHVSSLDSRIKARKVVLHIPTNENYFGLMLYEDLGSALTYISDKPKLMSVCDNILALIADIHFKTLSSSYGKKLLSTTSTTKNHAFLATNLLFRDLIREDPNKYQPTIDFIKEKYFPIFNNQKAFCLIHGDITMSNIIQCPDNTYTLIDWTNSLWLDPSYDIANIVFWELIFNLKDRALFQLNKLLSAYKVKGFNIEDTFCFYLARRFIDQGRFTDKKYIDIGIQILKANSISEAFDVAELGLDALPTSVRNVNENLLELLD